VILYVIEIKSLRSLMHRWPTEPSKDEKALTLLRMFICPDLLTLSGIRVIRRLARTGSQIGATTLADTEQLLLAAG
jgi:hypothetical protein